MDNNSNKLAAKTARPSLVVRQEGRKSLFGGHATKPTPAVDMKNPALPRSKSSPGVASKNTNHPGASIVPSSSPAPAPSVMTASPGGSRIPRLGSSGFGNRKPLSLAEAYRLAGEEEQNLRPGPIDGSPSPAPRSWRMRPAGNDNDAQMRNVLAHHHHMDARGLPSPSNHRIAMRNSLDDAIGKSRTSRWVLEEGGHGNDLPDIGTAANVPLPITGEEFGSPEKSYAWQVEDDFTAGDIEVSESPRLRVGSNNNEIKKPPFASRTSPFLRSSPNKKLQEIRQRELELLPPSPHATQSPRQWPTKLDDIRTREQAVAEKQALPLVPERRWPRPGGGRPATTTTTTTNKLDDIRRLEAQGPSKRAIAAAKLAEIKERNAMTRSVSSDGSQHRRETDSAATAAVTRPKSAFESIGRPVPDTPVTIYKSQAEKKADDVRRAAQKKRDSQDGKKEGPVGDAAGREGGLLLHKREKSRDLLRRLSRAASFSPRSEEPKEPKASTKPKESQEPNELTKSKELSKSKEASESRREPRASSLKPSSLADDRSRHRASNRTSADSRPTVGFASTTRSESSDSRKSRAGSSHSEQDPTDRIAAEQRLFAPIDNYSERSSIRAPSPEDRQDNDATPRQPSKQDLLLSMPTPRAPGAYVETPLTLRKKETGDDGDHAGPRRRASLESGTSEDAKQAAAKLLLRDEGRLAWRSRDMDTASDPGAADDAQETCRRRHRHHHHHHPRAAASLPRRRPQPPANSTKLPSVRDDLLELQRIHDIDDHTLDNLEEILRGKQRTNRKLDELLRDVPLAAADAARKIKREEAVDDMDEQQQQLADEKIPVVAAAAAVTRNVKREQEVFDREKLDDKIIIAAAEKDEQGKAGDTVAALDDELAAYEQLSASVERDILAVGKKVGKDSGSTLKPKKEEEEEEALLPGKHRHERGSGQQDAAADEKCPLCAAQSATTTTTTTTTIPQSRASSVVYYLYLPLPRLFYSTPHLRLTLLGMMLSLCAAWYVAETAVCSAYCRPATCAGDADAAPCTWSFDDPTAFGTALPVKLDQWTTGGYGRVVYDVVRDDVGDWMADVWDGLWGAAAEDEERKHVDAAADGDDGLTPAQRRRRRRRRLARLRRSGGGGWSVKSLGAEQKAKIEAWRRERLARERRRERGEDEGGIGREETVGGDERVG